MWQIISLIIQWRLIYVYCINDKTSEVGRCPDLGLLENARTLSQSFSCKFRRLVPMACAGLSSHYCKPPHRRCLRINFLEINRSSSLFEMSRSGARSKYNDTRYSGFSWRKFPHVELSILKPIWRGCKVKCKILHLWMYFIESYDGNKNEEW